MRKFFLQLIIGCLSIYLATVLVPGVYVDVEGAGDEIRTIVIAGIVLGLINFFLKPVVSLLTFPIKVLTFGLFGLIVNMLMLWLVDILFPSLVIVGLWALFWTSLLIWVLNVLLLKIGRKSL